MEFVQFVQFVVFCPLAYAAIPFGGIAQMLRFPLLPLKFLALFTLYLSANQRFVPVGWTSEVLL